jgi:hypothetical protein
MRPAAALQVLVGEDGIGVSHPPLVQPEVGQPQPRPGQDQRLAGVCLSVQLVPGGPLA